MWCGVVCCGVVWCGVRPALTSRVDFAVAFVLEVVLHRPHGGVGLGSGGRRPRKTIARRLLLDKGLQAGDGTRLRRVAAY